jgi:hypothetical protein
MAETAGDVLTVLTALGKVEAKRMGRAEAGQSRWWVTYPWGAATFYGTAEQALAHIDKQAREHEASAAGRT